MYCFSEKIKFLRTNEFSENQSGFKTGHSTKDNTFIIKSIINRTYIKGMVKSKIGLPI